MEEEKKSVEKTETGKEEKEIKISLSEKMLNSLFAIIALIALAFVKVLAHFGVGEQALYGIMAIIVFGFAITGVLWNLIRYGKPNFEFCFSAGVAFVALLAF
ncbi:MAG: hypothetical protein J6Y43_00775 [Clostridia bacterium]|nr:hypothetical protein [Clostridia bacterium]